MAASWNDGSIPFGAPILTIGSVTYICESFSESRPTNIIERHNEVNEPSGSVGIANFVTFTAVLQKAASSTAAPALGATFTYGAYDFYVTEVSAPLEQGGAAKFNISGRRKYN